MSLQTRVPLIMANSVIYLLIQPMIFDRQSSRGSHE